MQDNQTLSIIALGNKQGDFLKEFSQLLSLHACEIIQSHVLTQGELYNLSFFIQGKWSILAKLEPKLKRLADKYSYDVMLRYSALAHKTENKSCLSYSLYIVSLANATGLYQLVRFLMHKNANILEIYTDTYQTRRNPITMTTFNIKIQLSSDISIADWRESFMLFCDDYNLDAIMEPDKGI
jgi:glycine cleavage system transcriptional repressor